MDSWPDSTETSALIISNDESLPKKQEYTRDGTVDFIGMPASFSKTGGQRAVFFILSASMLCGLAYYGVYINLVLYLKSNLMEDSASAAMTANSLSGFGYLVSLLGAFIDDAYLGRYWSTVLFFSIYLLGSLAASILIYLPAFSSACTNVSPQCIHPLLKFSLFVFLYLSAVGIGGYQPCITALGADQFDDSVEKERAQKITYFNLYYISYNTGCLLGNIVIVYIEEKHGYALGFACSTVAVGLALAFFLLGTPVYRLHRLSGNPFSRVTQVIVATIQNWHVQAPVDNNLLHELHDDAYAIQGTRKILYSNRFRFFDKAATLTPNDKVGETRHLCTVTQVEEVKCLVGVLPVWIAIIGFGAMFGQVNTMFVQQSAMMDTHIGKLEVPPTYIFMFDTISVYVLAVLYEKILQPIAIRSGLKGGLTSLQRIGIGLICTMLAMAAAALVENFRLNIALNPVLDLDTGKPFRMSVLWQIPQYTLVGASEVFTYMGHLEFFYDQAPDALRGLGSALSLASMAVGSYLGNFIISLTVKATRSKDSPGWIPRDLDKGRLDLFFWLLAFLCFLNFIYFLVCAHFYKYIKVGNRDHEDL